MPEIELRNFVPFIRRFAAQRELARFDVATCGLKVVSCRLLIDRHGALIVSAPFLRAKKTPTAATDGQKAVRFSRPLARRIVEAAAAAYERETGIDLLTLSGPVL